MTARLRPYFTSVKRSPVPFIIAIVFAASLASAQDEAAEVPGQNEPEKSLIRFAGVSQFAEGMIERIDASKARTPVSYQTAIYEDDRIQMSAGSTLKIVTRQDCIVVFHGEGLALAANREKPWRAKTSAVRWICPEGKSETFVFQNIRYKLTSGEVLIDGSKLLLVSGQLRASRTPEGGFAVRKLYSFDKGTYTIATAQDERASWEFHRSRKPPKESAAWPEPTREIPEAAEVKTRRFLFGIVGSGGQVGYDVTPLGQDDMGGEGGRFQFHTKLESGRSFISSLTLGEFSSPNSQGSGTMVGKISNNVFLALLDFGLRSRHDRVFSSFFRAGGGVASTKIHVNRSDLGYVSENEYEFYVASLAGGFDAIYCPSWLGSLGLTAGVEAQLLHSLARGAKNTRVSSTPVSYPEESREPSSLTVFSVALMLGLAYEF